MAWSDDPGADGQRHPAHPPIFDLVDARLPDTATPQVGVGEATPKTARVLLSPATSSPVPRRINFAIPTAPGQLRDVSRVQVRTANVAGPLATARRSLAAWPDGSVRSVHLQLEMVVSGPTTIDVTINERASGGDLAFVPVVETLAEGTEEPAVWAILPSTWLSESRIAGPALPSASAWDRVCDYERFDTEAFLKIKKDKGSWLYDRPTALYRGYQRTGKASVLRDAYREAALYRSTITGTGSATRIGIAGATEDLKYHYTQGLALHYLLTGDDRFREAAEDIATRVHDLWPDPGYAASDDFWTERHAGFALLAYEWAAAVTDEGGKRAELVRWAQTAVDAYLQVQSLWPSRWTSADERCFPHEAKAHGEDFGYVGCSPWMSAILADALDTHAERVGRAGDLARARRVWTSLVHLGRFVAAKGLDPTTGRPYYWAGVGNGSNELDAYDEHWGESAYVVALAWYWSGRKDSSLQNAAARLVQGLEAHGEPGQLRSFNWQCRSGVMAPYYLR